MEPSQRVGNDGVEPNVEEGQDLCMGGFGKYKYMYIFA